MKDLLLFVKAGIEHNMIKEIVESFVAIIFCVFVFLLSTYIPVQLGVIQVDKGNELKETAA